MKKLLIRMLYRYFWIEHYSKFKSFFNPRQKWLTKKIPNTWCDKMELLKMTCFESIVHFVEEEEAFERIEWSSSPGHSDAQKDFERAYNIVKIEIPKLEKEIDDLWEKEIRYPSMLERLEPIEGSTSFTLRPPTEERKKLWDDVRELDQKLEDLIDEVCLLVIKNRNYMWT